MPLPLCRLALIAGLALTCLAGPAGAEQPATARKVAVNGKTLSEAEIRALEKRAGGPVQSGAYWYDRVSGAWGHAGGPLAGLIPPGLELGGPLRADASRGDTGVFINGRQLARVEVAQLAQWTGGAVPQGRYWVDASGNFGFEGGPALGNLAQLAQQSGVRYGSSSHNPSTGIGAITDGEGHGAVFTGNGQVVTTP